MNTRKSQNKQRVAPFRAAMRRALLAGLVLLCGPTLRAENTGADKIDFNRQIRPILSQNCFLCHGPDEKERKGKLRLDLRDDALKAGSSGNAAIVPGDPGKSEVMARVTHSDPDELMPPTKSGKKLSSEQVGLLRKWIEQGANYATHWAYSKPVRPPLPAPKDGAWPKNGIDHFILGRLDQEGLKPMAEADKYALARRVSLDLTGLPPSIEEVDKFANDNSPDAYENYVDDLLAKESFGEHWARLWLDLARYADSAGYADDPLRSIWAFRDYVIKSFNANKPFDQFTVEQMAGDLLPEPTEEQLVATAFHRNTMTNNEGGTNDEEFRNAAIVDRVNTTMTVWMGTSMACAQCHTHKYDPISQDEYFQFMAFLNNTEDADRGDETPVHKFFTRSQGEQREKLQIEISALDLILRTSTPELESSFAKWEQGFPRELNWKTSKPGSVKYNRELPIATRDDGTVRADPGRAKETYSVELPIQGTQLTGVRLEALPDEALPEKGAGLGADGSFLVNRISAILVPPNSETVPGRYVRIEIPGKEKILSLAEVQVFSGSENVARAGEASQSSTEYDAQARLAIDGNTDGNFQAKSTTHSSTSENPWWELDLKEARAIQRLVIWSRTDNDLHKRLKDFRITVLNEKREPLWERMVKDAPNPSSEFAVDGTRAVRFSVAYADNVENSKDAAAVLSEKADPKKGWTAGKGDGKEHWLALVTEQSLSVPDGSKLVVTIEQNSGKNQSLGSFRFSTTENPALPNFGKVAPEILALMTREPTSRSKEDSGHLLNYYLRQIAPQLEKERTRVAELNRQLEAIKPNTVPILRELAGDKRRKTKFQFRGNWMDLGKEVTEAVPVALHQLPSEAPRNRLTLAKWLVDSNNPLTARVVANRFWEQIFGIGLVRTSEEFGSQGEPPSHPELLDWLAVELMEQKWDVKNFLKTLVTSATYRQSSKVTPELAERDPDNRLLARGPRFRMSAEMVRDQALSIAGLLSPKMYGPSVKPPRPASGLSAAFGSSVDWKTSEGEDRFRRALYTEWRRTSPYPSMATFDAPNREVCTVRRTRTNTPLQALVTLNDPVYFEASQALGRRMAQTKGSLADKVRHGFRTCLLRQPTEKELGRLVTLFGEALAEYAKGNPESARNIASEPIGPVPTGQDATELAAWTTVANVLLNLDETLMKR